MAGHFQTGCPLRRASFRKTPAATGTALALGLVMWGVIGNPESAAFAEMPSEYEVKAAFLYNFAKFVEWPAEPPNAIEFCIVGEDPFGDTLGDTVRGKSIHGKPITIRRVKITENPQGCQIAFISARDRATRSVLDRLQGTSTLTVGESPNFTRQGGMINFFLEGHRVRFEINADAAEQAHLKISSKLLILSRIVRNQDLARLP
jgi:hypothetical protein